MIKRNICNVRKEYYKKIYVLFEMLKLMKDREVVFMDNEENWKCIRGLTIKSINFFKDCFEMFNFFDKNYNIYISCAKYSDIPIFNFNLKKRSEETCKWFNFESYKNITSFDMLFDFDCKDKDRKKYNTQLTNFCTLLKKNKIPFYIFFSGNNYQIIIESEVWNYNNINLNRKIIPEVKYIIENIRNRFGLYYVDVVGVNVSNKIRKLPYSLVNNYICLPLHYINKNSFYTNTKKKYSMTEVMKKIRIEYRGLKMFCDLDRETNQKNFKRFLKKYHIV